MSDFKTKLAERMKIVSAARNKALNIERDKMMKRKPNNSELFFAARLRVVDAIAQRVARDRAMSRKKGGSNSYTVEQSLAY